MTTVEMADAKVRLYLEAFRREKTIPTNDDIDEICHELETTVRAGSQSPFRAMLASSHERFRKIVPRARLTLRADAQRMAVEQRIAAEAAPVPRPLPPARVHIDGIDSFGSVRSVTATDVLAHLKDGYFDVAEDFVQQSIERILGVPMHKKDWGGELNDLVTSNLVIDGSRVDTAFLLKGNGLKKRVMEIRDCGKNGDQLVRLADSPASLFVVQFVGMISENVVRDIAGKVEHLRSEGRPARYCIIDGQDTARLLQAYGFIQE
jgi:hypothetical protein